MIRTFLVKDKEKFTKIRKVNLVREKNVRLEELVGERLIGSEEPLEDEVKAIKECIKAKEKGNQSFSYRGFFKTKMTAPSST